MTLLGYVLVTLNLFCLLPCLILLIVGGRASSPLSRMFVWLAALNMLGLLTEACMWIFENNSSTMSYYIVRISNIANHLAAYTKVAAFSEYVYACIRQRTRVSRAPFRAIWVCVAGSCALLAVDMFNHLYVRFDELNVYRAQDTYFLSQILPTIGILILIYTMHRYGKRLPKRQLSALRWYFALLFMCSGVLLFINTDVALHYIVSTLGQMILYANIQMDEAQERELELAESRAAVMLSQIGPHFVLNTLTDIGQLCRMDPPRAQQAIVHFSRYLRGNMDSLTSKRSIPFTEELEHVKHYLWLESMRLQDRLRVRLDVPAQNFRLPALSLQPLVENAVRHGVARKESGGTVTVTTEETETAWRVTVSDDGAGFDPDATPEYSAPLPPADNRNRVGIKNVRNRLAAMCGGSLSVTGSPGRGTVAVIEIPKKGAY